MAVDSRPLLVWLGAPPAAGLRASLEREVRLHEGWTDGAQLVVAWAGSGMEVLAALPREHPEVLAVSEGAPRVRDRLAWIRAGAADLVGLRELRPALTRRVQALPVEAAPVEAAPVEAAPVEAAPAPLEERPVLPEPPPSPLSAAPRGPFAPVALAPAEPVEEAARTLEALERYIRRRRTLAARLGEGGEQALIDLLHQRDLLLGGGTPDPYGRRAGGKPGWIVAVRAATDPFDEAAVSQGTLVGLGRDALTLALSAARGPRERLVLDLSLGERGHVQLLVACRWQRRVAVQRWLLGALILKLRRRADASARSGAAQPHSG